MTSSSPILWKNDDSSIVLIDIPQSITHAQGQLPSNVTRHLLSSRPLEVPFPSNEPKSPAARAELRTQNGDIDLQESYSQLLEQALKDARERYSGPWCLPRPFVNEIGQRRHKRRRQEENCHDVDEKDFPHGGSNLTRLNTFFEDEDLVSIAHSSSAIHQTNTAATNTPTKQDLKLEEWSPFDNSISNQTSREMTLYLRESPLHERTSRYSIPPRSSFHLSDCGDPISFHHAIRSQHTKSKTGSLFDFILLDPPWPNRSVKRTHKSPGTTYSITPNLSELHKLLLNTQLENLMAESCLLGIWITNSPSVRRLVLQGDESLFSSWKLELIEEWIWLKTTVHGEPILPLDSMWRKPYEVLLLARQSSGKAPICNGPPDFGGTAVRRKVIIGVPDLHSRKPCLKTLAESMIPRSNNDIRVLEVFARHLVEGWWSWGDECIKFNRDCFWRYDEIAKDSMNVTSEPYIRVEDVYNKKEKEN